jgi:hypothetical protein
VVPQALTAARQAKVLAEAEHTTAMAPNSGATPADKAAAHKKLVAAGATADHARAKAVQATNVLNALLFNLAGDQKAFLDQQQIEVQLFGQLDVTSDVEAIYLSPKEPDDVKNNTRAFGAAHGIKVEETASRPGTQALFSTDPGQDKRATTEIQGYLDRLHADISGKADFDRLAGEVLQIQTIKATEKDRYEQLVNTLVDTYNDLGYFAQRKKGRRQVFKQLQAGVLVKS